jgi:hypothetical protein
VNIATLQCKTSLSVNLRKRDVFCLEHVGAEPMQCPTWKKSELRCQAMIPLPHDDMLGIGQSCEPNLMTHMWRMQSVPMIAPKEITKFQAHGFQWQRFCAIRH